MAVLNTHQMMLIQMLKIKCIQKEVNLETTTPTNMTQLKFHSSSTRSFTIKDTLDWRRIKILMKV